MYPEPGELLYSDGDLRGDWEYLFPAVILPGDFGGSEPTTLEDFSPN